MSLRLRLTLIYTGLLSSVVLLLSIVIYSLISILMVNLVDDRLAEGSNLIIDALWVDSQSEIFLDIDTLNIPDNYYFQIWSADKRLLIYSDSASELNGKMDSVGMLGESPIFRQVTLDRTAFRVLTVPLQAGGEPTGFLQIGLALTEIREAQRLIQIVFSIAAVFLL